MNQSTNKQNMDKKQIKNKKLHNTIKPRRDQWEKITQYYQAEASN
jgi:hypothetical protein